MSAMIAQPKDMETKFVIEQYDRNTGESLGCMAGPHDTMDELLLDFGHDTHSYISSVTDGVSTKVMRWSETRLTWESVDAPPYQPKAAKATSKAFDVENYISRASEIADGMDLAEDPTPPSGSFTPKVVIIGDYPEASDGPTLYNGEQGQILKEALLEARLGPARAYLTTITKHRLLDEKQKLDYAELRRFIPNLFGEIMALNPKMVFLLGLPTARAVLGMPDLAQNVAIRQVFSMKAMPNTTFRLAYHPRFVLHAGGVGTRTFHTYVKQFSPFAS